MALNLPDNPGLCDGMAQLFGALAYVDGVCVPVSGKEIIIEDQKYSLMEHAEICNFNMHCSGVKPAVPTQQHLPGPVQSPVKQQFA